MDSKIQSLLLDLVKDLEKTRYKYDGYAYARTIRNILTGNKDSSVADHFKDKYYYGVLNQLSLKDAEDLMDDMLKLNVLDCIFTEHGKLYCTHEYYQSNAGKISTFRV